MWAREKRPTTLVWMVMIIAAETSTEAVASLECGLENLSLVQVSDIFVSVEGKIQGTNNEGWSSTRSFGKEIILVFTRFISFRCVCSLQNCFVTMVIFGWEFPTALQ